MDRTLGGMMDEINDAQILAIALAEEVVARKRAELQVAMLRAEVERLIKQGHVTVLEPEIVEEA